MDVNEVIGACTSFCPQSSIGCDATAGAGLGKTDSGLALEVCHGVVFV